MPLTNPPINDPNDPRDADEPAPRVTEDGITEVGFDDPELRPLPPDKLHYHVPHPEPHPELHEHSDVPIKPLVLALGSIVGLCVLSFVFLYFLFGSYYWQQRNAEKPRSAVPVAQSNVPEPRLQGVPGFSDNHPTKDMRQLRDRHKAELEGHGKGPNGAAVIPIDEAMTLALEKGLFPVRKPQPAGQGGTPATRPTTVPALQASPQGQRPQRPAAPQGTGGQQ
jgi:hypothetical protein